MSFETIVRVTITSLAFCLSSLFLMLIFHVAIPNAWTIGRLGCNCQFPTIALGGVVALAVWLTIKGIQ